MGSASFKSCILHVLLRPENREAIFTPSSRNIVRHNKSETRRITWRGWSYAKGIDAPAGLGGGSFISEILYVEPGEALDDSVEPVPLRHMHFSNRSNWHPLIYHDCEFELIVFPLCP